MSDTRGFTDAYQQATDAFTQFVPGFDFLQGLVRDAGKSLPAVGQWVAPTLDPEELDRRINELRTVQFWLEQNARMLGATIQALEVQRMTLGALQGMNVSMGDLSEALKVKVPDLFTAVASAPAAMSPAPSPSPAPSAAQSDDAPAAAGASPVDPMQWWGSLTQQFSQLAAQAVQATSEAAAQAGQAMQVAQAAQAAEAAAVAAKSASAAGATSATAAAPKAAASAAVKKPAPAAAKKAAPRAPAQAAKTAAAKAAAPKAVKRRSL